MSATTTSAVPQTSEGEGVNTGTPVEGQAPAPVTNGAPATKEEPKLTQGEVDRLIESRLAEERRRTQDKLDKERKAAAEKAAVENGEWKKLYDEAKEEMAALQAQITERDTAIVRAKVAAKHRIPALLVDRIRGANEQEMDADAKELAKTVAAPTAPETEAGRRNQGGRDITKEHQRAADESRIYTPY